jgi:putative transposase
VNRAPKTPFYDDDETLHDIRQALNHELVLGRSYFKEKIEQITRRQTGLGAPGRPRIAEELGVYFVD